MFNFFRQLPSWNGPMETSGFRGENGADLRKTANCGIMESLLRLRICVRRNRSTIPETLPERMSETLENVRKHA